MRRDHALTVINLFGPPAVGKSALAATLFGAMKRRHLSVGHVLEYATDLLLRLPPVPKDKIAEVLATRQLKIFAEQHYRQEILDGVYAVAVTDSPLLLSRFYAPDIYFAGFPDLVMEAFKSFDNLNFYLTRDMASSPFDPAGRAHSASESCVIDREMRKMLDSLEVPYIVIDLSQPAPELEIMRHLQEHGSASVKLNAGD
jgi:hypothetical protein